MTNQEIEDKAYQLMSKYDLFTKGWTFKLDNAKRRFGCCKYNKKQITLSKFLLPHVANDSDIIDTILHEIAHALVGSRHGHDHVWKAKAIEIGCKAQRCGGDKIKDRSELAKTYKWIGTCPNGHVMKRYKLTTRTKRGSCSRCSNSYNPDYLFTWKENK